MYRKKLRKIVFGLTQYPDPSMLYWQIRVSIYLKTDYDSSSGNPIGKRDEGLIWQELIWPPRVPIHFPDPSMLYWQSRVSIYLKADHGSSSGNPIGKRNEGLIWQELPNKTPYDPLECPYTSHTKLCYIGRAEYQFTLKLTMAPVREIQLGKEMKDWSDKNEIGWSDVASNSSLQSQVNPSIVPLSWKYKIFIYKTAWTIWFYLLLTNLRIFWNF